MGVFLKGKRIALKTVGKQDLAEFESLMSDREIDELAGEVYPVTQRSIEDFYEKCQRLEERVWFLIVDTQTNKIIGETGFLRINAPWRTADYSLVIWDRNFWNKGYAKETTALMLDYGFNYLNFHRLAIGVVDFNANGLKFWKSVGFKEEGRQKDGYFCRGKYCDFIMMYILEDDYRLNWRGLNAT